MDLRHFLCLVVPFFFLLFLDHQVEGRHSGLVVGKGETSGNSDIYNKGLGSAGGQQGGTMVAEKIKREDKQVLKSRRQMKNEKKRTKKKKPGRRPKTGKNRRRSKKPGKSTSGQKKRKQQTKRQQKKKQQNKKQQKKKQQKKKQHKKKQQKKKQQKKKKKLKQKKDKEKEKRTDNDRKHNRSCSVDSSCIVNAQIVLLYEKNQVIQDLILLMSINGLLMSV